MKSAPTVCSVYIVLFVGLWFRPPFLFSIQLSRKSTDYSALGAHLYLGKRAVWRVVREDYVSVNVHRAKLFVLRNLVGYPRFVGVKGQNYRGDTVGLKTGYSVMDGFTRAAYPEDFAERRKESWDIMLDHRLNPTDISRTTLPDLDMLEYAKKRGMNSFCALHLVPPPLDANVEWVCYAEPDEIFNEKFYGYLKSLLPAYIRELEKRGLKDMAYLYGFDERESEYYPRMLEMWKRLKKDFGLPLMTSSRVYRDVRRGKIPFESELATMTDVQCPVSSDYDVGLSGRYRALGKEVWWYTCFGPRYPYANNAHYEYPVVECRLLGWMTWTERADGYLFWLVNAWNRTDKLDENETYFPEWNVATALDSPGDGIFIYPGRNGVLPGVRLANVRDGVEDFEKLQIAECMLGRDFVSQTVRDVVRTAKDFSRKPNDIRSVLGRLSEKIAKGVR